MSIFNTPERVKIRESFSHFIRLGGMPEFLRFNDTDILKQVYDNIVTNDIAIRFNISKTYEMRELYQYMITNFARKYSYSSVAKNVSLESKITVKDYISFFEITFLGKQIYKFDHSFKRQLANDKKLYIIDNAFIPLISNSLTKDTGRLLENLVFNTLQKRYDVFYYYNKNECDFITLKNNRINGLYQICYEMNNQNRNREISGLQQAMQIFGQNEGYILTNDQEETINENGLEIKILPVWKWLLSINPEFNE